MRILGKLVEDVFKMILYVTLLFFRDNRILMRTLRVFAPASETEPKLTFLAMTVGLRSRSARLFSAGT